MKTMEAITTRRSVRSFRPDPLPDDLVQSLLTAAMSGPSTANQEPWQFVVLRDRERLDSLAAHPAYKHVVSQAPLVVVVCADMDRSKFGDHWVIDCSIATQNLLLAAHAAGLGAVWMGCVFIEDRAAVVRECLRSPQQIVPFAVVPIGHPTAPVTPVERFKPDRVHNDGW
jgi:nitroreductase